tara:strand:+ start:71 stop:832 length:762 start_codon:yes stop_codon:yes gene_type:complete
MKKLIKKILKEELSDDDLNWIREIDPMDSFVEWAESLRSTHYGFQDESDYDWLKLIEDTKSFIEEFTDETHTLLEMVENLNSSAGLQHTSDMLANIQEYLGDDEEQYDDFYVDLYRTDSKKLRKFLKNFKSYGDKYDLTLEQLLNLSHKYFERQVYGDKKNSETLKEYNDREKRSTTEITMSLLGEASDHFAQGLRLIESATQFAYEANNEDLIRDLETLRMSIQSGDDKMWAENPNSMNIINKINDIVRKYS